MPEWQPIESAKKDDKRVWLLLTNEQVAFGCWRVNPPKSYLPGHWNTDLGICSNQSELGEPIAWQSADVPSPPKPPSMKDEGHG